MNTKMLHFIQNLFADQTNWLVSKNIFAKIFFSLNYFLFFDKIIFLDEIFVPKLLLVGRNYFYFEEFLSFFDDILFADFFLFDENSFFEIIFWRIFLLTKLFLLWRNSSFFWQILVVLFDENIFCSYIIFDKIIFLLKLLFDEFLLKPIIWSTYEFEKCWRVIASRIFSQFNGCHLPGCYNIGNHFDMATGVFLVPVTGVYTVSRKYSLNR